jgi:ABC-type dipeptide/oligopeptide/nickel transport system ATPase subunit
MHNNSLANQQISNLITPISYFINHVKQLNDLQRNLDKYKKASILGTSGTGKTQLARTYAYENRDKYNIIWFIDCNLDSNKEFVKLAKYINQETNANLSEDAEISKKEAMSYLSHQNKWLLVLDNLKINENRKIQDLIDWEHNGNIVFCSQDSEALPHVIEITSFNQKDSVTLASNLLDSADKNDITFLSQAFSGYPILIVQGAQLLNKIKGLNKEEYKKKIYQSADKIKLNITLAIQELKPSAVKLLAKIALINNQQFSKQLLRQITDDISSIEDDIYQLSKFMLIVNVKTNEDNPIFEMHDIIAQKVVEINGDKNNQIYLEDIITKFISFIPKGVVKSYVFREEETVRENLEIITKNAQKYTINIYILMELNLQLIIQYVNTLDLYNSRILVDWFNINNEEGKFKIRSMDNNVKAVYARFLGMIGWYHRRCSDYTKAAEYYNKEIEVYNDVMGFEASKCNAYFGSALTNISLGDIVAAENNIKIMEKMFDANLVDKSDIATLTNAKGRLYFAQGKYLESLKYTNKTIETFVSNNLKRDDLFFSNLYILKAEILNNLESHKDAFSTARQLYNMHKVSTKENSEIFGRIYTQMARSSLGLGEADKASEYITKAIAIFLADERRNPKDADYSEDSDLAASYVVQGDIFFIHDDLKQAINSYKKSQLIYFYLYREKSKNLAHVSYLYKQGAKAACKAQDLYNYKTFGKLQVEEFGVDNPNTIDMLEYCEQYKMDLWAKEN